MYISKQLTPRISALTSCFACSFFSHMDLINWETTYVMLVALTDRNFVSDLDLSSPMLGLEAIWEIQVDWSGRSKNERRPVFGEACVASNPRGFVLSSTSCKLETANVRGCSSVNLQSWNGRNTCQTGLFGPQADEGQEHLFRYNFRGFPFSSAQWISFFIPTPWLDSDSCFPLVCYSYC